MLQTIIQRLSTTIQDRIQTNVGLAELIYSGEKMQPALYVGSGQYVPISIDNHAGIIYFRQVGEVQSSKIEVRGCGASEFIFPLILVACVSREVIGKDDPFSADSLCVQLTKDLISASELASDLSARKATIEIKSYSTNMKSILSDEYSGIDLLKNSIPYTYVLVSISMDIKIEINNDCIPVTCNQYCHE